MLKTMGVFLLTGVCLSIAYGQSKPSAGAVEAIKQLERDWLEAEKAGDIGKLTEIVADDWSSINFDGTRSTKEEFLKSVKSGQSKMQSFEIGPMDVKVIGTVAVVQGSDIEKSSYQGKDTSGKWVWMDVFLWREGKWQAVRSQTSMIK